MYRTKPIRLNPRRKTVETVYEISLDNEFSPCCKWFWISKLKLLHFLGRAGSLSTLMELTKQSFHSEKEQKQREGSRSWAILMLVISASLVQTNSVCHFADGDSFILNLFSVLIQVSMSIFTSLLIDDQHSINLSSVFRYRTNTNDMRIMSRYRCLN